MYLDNPMSVAYEAAKIGALRRAPAGQQHPGHRRFDHGADGRPDARVLRAAVQPGQHRPGLRRQGGAGTPLVELAEAHCGGWQGGPAARQAVPAHGTGDFRAILRAEDQQQTVVGVGDGPPLESPDRYAAHLLATILGDHTGSRLYWALIDPGYADGAELSYQDYNQAGAFFTFLSCEPDSTQDNLGRIAEVYRDA